MAARLLGSPAFYVGAAAPQETGTQECQRLTRRHPDVVGQGLADEGAALGLESGVGRPLDATGPLELFRLSMSPRNRNLVPSVNTSRDARSPTYERIFRSGRAGFSPRAPRRRAIRAFRAASNRLAITSRSSARSASSTATLARSNQVPPRQGLAIRRGTRAGGEREERRDCRHPDDETADTASRTSGPTPRTETLPSAEGDIGDPPSVRA